MAGVFQQLMMRSIASAISDYVIISSNNLHFFLNYHYLFCKVLVFSGFKDHFGYLDQCQCTFLGYSTSTDFLKHVPCMCVTIHVTCYVTIILGEFCTIFKCYHFKLVFSCVNEHTNTFSLK